MGTYFIPVSMPDITDEEKEEVLKVLETPFLSLGPKHKGFEALFSKYLGISHSVSVSSGTAGLHLAIKALGLGRGDAIITTPFSFIASSNVLLYEDIYPIFVDVERETLNMDPGQIERFIEKNTRVKEGKLIDSGTGSKIKAILPVHIFGHPANMEEIMRLAEKYNLFVIEDACEALGAEVKLIKGTISGGPQITWYKVGTFGKIGVFAFYPNKQITTGEGGMVVTSDDNIASLIRSMRNQGRGGNGAWLVHERLGYNYRMDELSAALGIAQMRRLPEILMKRSEIAKRYDLLLSPIDEIEIPTQKDYAKISWFVYVVRLNPEIPRDDMIKFLKEMGIETRPYFPPIHLQPYYISLFGFKKGGFPVTESESKRTLALPFYNNLKEKDQVYIVEKLKEGVSRWISERQI